MANRTDGYIVMAGEPGCLPGYTGYAENKREAKAIERSFRGKEVDIVPAKEFAEANGIDTTDADWLERVFESF